jgi:methionine--tRNA ligase beta chain
MENISLEEFKKLDLRIGKILTAERVEGSEKLLKLEVDFGAEIGKRQIISGIAKSYEPEFLCGKESLFIANLEPRSIMGLESNGMIMCTTLDNSPIILQPEKEVLPGTQIK